MLALERRPVEPRAKSMFIRVRAQAFDQLVANFADVMPELSDAEVQSLATYAMAGVDGIFVAKEIGGDTVDLLALFNMYGHAIYDTARRLVREKKA